MLYLVGHITDPHASKLGRSCLFVAFQTFALVLMAETSDERPSFCLLTKIQYPRNVIQILDLFFSFFSIIHK